MNKEEVKRAIIDAGQQAYSCGLVSAAGGNISMRMGDRFFITATNAPLRNLMPEDIVEIDADGKPVGDSCGRTPSKEAVLHLAVFKKRPDIDSIIHVHPVYSISCTIASPNDFPIHTVSAINKIGSVGYVPFAQAGSRELVDFTNEALDKCGEEVKTLLMEKHGIIVFDKGMNKCYERTELVEETAKIGIYSLLVKAAKKLLEE